MTGFLALLNELEIDFKEKCISKKRICLYLIISLEEMERELNVNLGANKRKNRPCLIKVLGEKRAHIAFLTSNERKVEIKTQDCIKGDCKNKFYFLEKSYLFEDFSQQPLVKEISLRLVEDQDILMFCGPCTFSEEIPI